MTSNYNDIRNHGISFSTKKDAILAGVAMFVGSMYSYNLALELYDQSHTILVSVCKRLTLY